MRHAARTPPPPDFVAWRLWRLTLFRKLHSFRLSGPAFVVTWFLPVLYWFSALYLVLGGELLIHFARIDAKSHPKAMENEALRVPKSIKKRSKRGLGRIGRPLQRQSVPRTRPGAGGHSFFRLYNATCAILVAILHPTGFWRGSLNRIFWHSIK